MDPLHQLILPIIKDVAIGELIFGFLSFLFGARGNVLAFTMLGIAIMSGLVGFFNSPYHNSTPQLVQLESTQALADIPIDTLAGTGSAPTEPVLEASNIPPGDYGHPLFLSSPDVNGHPLFLTNDPDMGHPLYMTSDHAPQAYDQLDKHDIQNRNDMLPKNPKYWWMK